MRTIINGRKYDTDTAKFIATDWSDLPKNDFAYWEESLYRKKTGEFFLYGYGGPMSIYSKTIGQNEWITGEKIIPMTIEQAMAWGEKHMTVWSCEETFGAVEE